MVKRPTSITEIINDQKMIEIFGPELKNFTDNELVTFYITNVTFNPENVEELKADHAMVQALCTFPVLFEGYVEVICNTPDKLLFECYCHFLQEGLDEPQCRAEIERICNLLQAAGLEAPALSEA